MIRQAYPSDLSDAQWEVLEPLLPATDQSAPNSKYERREIVNAILYVLRSGCPWRLLPHDLPAWGTVYWYFRRWRREGIWDQVLASLRSQVRQQAGRQAEPSAGIIDSQSIKTSAVRGPEKGYDAGKKIYGRKRHVLVDTQGHLLAVKVLASSRSDQQGAKRLLEPLRGVFARLSHVWGDSAYGGTLISWLAEHLGWTIEVVRRPKVTNAAGMHPVAVLFHWDQLFPARLPVPPKRWVVERSFAWKWACSCCVCSLPLNILHLEIPLFLSDRDSQESDRRQRTATVPSLSLCSPTSVVPGWCLDMSR